ncbi:MAG TPA: methyltransferase domain-containing protein [Ktedonobacterales bacterium]|jgi:ubiquinone/menaquinone biosynthesis C-methylase UbiE
MSTPEEAARAIFGQRAAFYTTSSAHTDQHVLGRVVALAQAAPDWNALDVATGTGHTAFALAPLVRAVVGIDLTPEMLAEAQRLQAARTLPNVSFQVADVHHLPFADAAFDLVTCRRAAHHFSNIGGALQEMRRVLRPGGRLVVDDRSVPEDDEVDALMNQLDLYHDASHVREYRPSAWQRLLEEAGFLVEATEPYTRHRPLRSLTEGVAEREVQRIQHTLAQLTPRQRAVFDLREDQGELAFNHWYVLLAARKTGG